MLSRALLATAAAGLLAAASCTSFPALTAGTCGNGVVDSGEDCDGFAGGAAKCRSPGADGQCRFDCSDTGHTCPPGYGCGTDSICRTGTTAFTAGPHVAAPNVTALTHGDFDGDGRADLVTETVSDVRIAYFDRGMTLAQSTTLPQSRARAATGVLSTPPPDGTNATWDLVLASSGGVDIWAGHTDRTLSPIVYPSFPIPGTEEALIPIDANPKIVGTQILVLGPISPTSGSSIFQVDKRQMALPVALFNGLPPPHELVAPAAVGHFVEDVTKLPCQEFILAFAMQQAVHVFSPCHPDGTPNVATGAQTLLPDVLIPGGGTITGFTTLLLNGDLHPDLLVGTTAGVYAAFGVGDGTFNSSLPLPAAGSGDGNAALLALTIVDRNNLISGFPLAAGDIDGDGLSDLVFPGGIAFANGSGKFTATNGYYSQTPWTTAAVADLNGDGKQDVVAAGGADVAFFGGTGSTLLDPATYSTDATIEHLAIGDVDGDMVNDIVFSEAALDDDGNPLPATDELDVMWGKTGGGFPETPVPIGQLPTIEEISIAPFEPTLLSPALSPAGTSDIACLASDTTAMQQLVAAFVGQADRELVSPFYLVDGKNPETVGSTFPLRFIVGHFTQTSHGEIAAIGGDSTRSPVITGRFWLIPVTGDEEVSTSMVQGSALLSPMYDYDFARLMPVDLTGAGIQVVVAAVPPATNSASDAGTLMIMSPSGVSKQVPLGVGDPTLKAWVLKTGDVDADGKVDVAALYADKTASGTAYKLRVLWNTGDIDPGAGADVPLPAGATLDGFALGNVDSDPELEALLNTSKGVFVSKVDKGSRTFGMPASLSGPSGVGGGLQAADFDGDGVIDIAIGNGNGADVYRGTPKID